MSLLTQNAELAVIGVWNWTLPAWVVDRPAGRGHYNACPSAGACVKVCYARNGTYLFPAVRAAHARNLEWTITSLDLWERAMLGELLLPRFRPTRRARSVPVDRETLDPWARGWLLSGGAAVRIHDAGDFHSDDYLTAWLRIAEAVPDVLFYAYTKEVTRLRRVLAERPAPVNFRWLFSLGGREDHLLDLDADRHADVFPSSDALEAAGYSSQEASDLLAVLLPTTRIGIPANNIPHFNKRLAGSTFGEVEARTRRHR